MRVHSFKGYGMQKDISRKREREEDCQDIQERDLIDINAVGGVVPVEIQQFEPPAEPPVKPGAFPYYLESFLYQNTRMFNDLINLSSPGSLVDYLKANRPCNAYFKQLYDALDAVLTLTKSRYTEIVSTSRQADEDVKSIDIRKLIAVLRTSKISTDQALVKLLTEGIENWRLPMIAHLYNSADFDDYNNTMQALIWLEKRRSFIQSSINQDPKLMNWLSDEKHREMKKILEQFTQSLYNVLSNKSTFQFFDEERAVFQSIKLPELIDIRKLWYILYLTNQSSEDDNVKNSQMILNYSQRNPGNFEIFAKYDTAYPSPFEGFVDAFNGLPISERVVNNVPVTGDVLIWLLVAQRDNAKLASEIIRCSLEVDKVVGSYANHNKQVQKQERANLLAKSMANTLQDIHNSPTKLRHIDEGQLKKLSSEKTPGQESGLPKEFPAISIKF
jgi:succinate dehydrogenase flavin-adding protein (antitoxin of CptAB toxin-antitoxin module)